jgi:nitroimidazol reductase NimA-like FMN-containing flavoprotein (pyridoxamine 5'-phosphate oxidase superfamily)
VTDAISPGSFAATPRNRVKRLHERGRYDKATIYAILDAALIRHFAYCIDGQPYCTPTGFWREGDHLYWHGSSASRMLRAQDKGIPVCLTVTHVDSLVMARSGFHHSVNYRSAMVFGTAHAVTDLGRKLRLMDNYVDRVYPGRSRLIRPPNRQEFKATTMMEMEIESASGKIRDKHVDDEEEDYAGVPAWSALYPIEQRIGPPSPRRSRATSGHSASTQPAYSRFCHTRAPHFADPPRQAPLLSYPCAHPARRR